MKIKEQEPEGFPQFWSEWRPFMRKNDGRGEARATYRKHILSGAEPADIIDGAKAYLRSLTEREKPYIPLAATWLNREAYADWAEHEREYQKRIADAERIRDERRAMSPNIVQIEDHRAIKPSEVERERQVRQARERLGISAAE